MKKKRSAISQSTDYVNLERLIFLVERAQRLYQKLSEAGVDVTLVIVQNANHNFKPTGGPIKPTRTEISNLMADFFDRVLR